MVRTGKLRESRDSSVLRFNVLPSLSKQHPAAKPVELMRYLIRQTSDPGDLILDPFFGSGTTGIAAALEGRRCIGIEKEAKYVDLARRRLNGV